MISSTGSKILLTTALATMVALSVVTPVAGQFAAMEFGVLSRSGGQAGSEFELHAAFGTRVDEIEGLLFSDPRITAELLTLDPLPFDDKRLPNFGNFRVKIAADTPPGRYEVRAVGRHGVSNPRLFLVTSLTDVVAENVSHQSAAPTPLALDEVLHAQSTAAQIDFFSLSLQPGQQVRIDLVSQQLDSWMIGHLRVTDPAGKIVAAARGGDGVDPSLSLEAAQAGQYVLSVHDFLYRGGTEFFYQLVARSGPDRDTDLIGDQGMPRWLMTSSVTIPDAKPVAVEDLNVQPITPPCAIAAFFDDRDDEDWFEFAADEGQKYVIEVVSHRIGQPTDPRLVVLRSTPQPTGDPTFQSVLNADDSQIVGGNELTLRTKDPVAMFTAPATGNYRIVIADLDRGESFGKQQPYTLVVRKPNPGFQLVAYRPYPNKDANQSRQFGSKIFRGGSESIRVMALRQDGWTGSIQLAVNGLPPGIHCAPATLAANQTQTQLTLVADDDAVNWTGEVDVVGKGMIEGQETAQLASPATFQWGRANGREHIQSRLISKLVIAVTDKDLAPISINLDDAAVLEGKKDSSLQLPIKLIRRDGGKAACVLRPRDLPPGVTAGELTIAADQAEGTLPIKITPQAIAGTYSLWLQMETKIKVKANPQVLQRAQEHRAHLQKLHDDPAQADNLEAIQAAITAADARVEAAKPNAKEQEQTVFIPSPHVTIRVVDP